VFGIAERSFNATWLTGGGRRVSLSAGGSGGQGPRGIDALVKAMVGLSDIFAAHRDHLSDMEINPIMVRAQGDGVAAVDVRLLRK